MNNECYVKVKSEWIKAEFIGIFQHSNIIEPSPMVGGHPGGVIAYPTAVVRLNEGLKEIKISNVNFKKLCCECRKSIDTKGE